MTVIDSHYLCDQGLSKPNLQFCLRFRPIFGRVPGFTGFSQRLTRFRWTSWKLSCFDLVLLGFTVACCELLLNQGSTWVHRWYSPVVYRVLPSFLGVLTSVA